jgi:hypothetical protein
MILPTSTALVFTLVQVSNCGGQDLREFLFCYSYIMSNTALHSGGKTGASTIENDHDFSVALAALMKKKKDTCGVGVEFDLDNMDGFRIRKRVSGF